jgi:hypothetical protein
MGALMSGKREKHFFFSELLGQVSYQDRWGDPGVSAASNRSQNSGGTGC